MTGVVLLWGGGIFKSPVLDVFGGRSLKSNRTGQQRISQGECDNIETWLKINEKEKLFSHRIFLRPENIFGPDFFNSTSTRYSYETPHSGVF